VGHVLILAIVIQEIAEEDWGFAGMLTDEWRKRKA
jgi:phenylpyruvate tautomerase PptA (4-oxalocrotonate tautomerase family)